MRPSSISAYRQETINGGGLRILNFSFVEGRLTAKSLTIQLLEEWIKKGKNGNMLEASIVGPQEDDVGPIAGSVDLSPLWRMMWNGLASLSAAIKFIYGVYA